jgi:7-carboxy-7-deazaguanine synthase
LYTVKEIFYSVQGEGLHSGMPTLFCRFARCNLWSGREKDREKAICKFCDTDFVGGTQMSYEDILAKLLLLWPNSSSPRVILTGGEPLLQTDRRLIDALKDHDFWIGIETNGTLPLISGIDHVCVSPKVGSKLLIQEGDEIKVVFPQSDIERFGSMNFKHFYLQPMDGYEGAEKETLEYCLSHPKWHLSLQIHKHLKIR